MKIKLSDSEVNKLLNPEAITERESLTDDSVAEEIASELNKLEESAKRLRLLTALFAQKKADLFNRGRLDNRDDKENATFIFPYVRYRETGFVEMVWCTSKTWVEDKRHYHSANVRQKTNSAGKTVNSAVTELTKFKMENGDYSMNMFRGEPTWVQIIGVQVENQLRQLRSIRKLMAEIMRKKNSAVTAFSKLSKLIKEEKTEVADETTE